MVPDCVGLFSPICDALWGLFWPSLLGGNDSKSESELLCLPTKFAGVGVWDPVKMTTRAFVSSREWSSRIVEALVDGISFLVLEHCEASHGTSSNYLCTEACK